MLFFNVENMCIWTRVLSDRLTPQYMCHNDIQSLRQNDWYFEDNIFELSFLNENWRILI